MFKKHLFLCLASAALLTSNFAKSEPLTKHDSHFHLYNYIQKGTTYNDFITLLRSSRISRTAVFGIPLQQRWNGADDNDWGAHGHGHDHGHAHGKGAMPPSQKTAKEFFNGRKVNETGHAPYYYLQTDEELYYFSATDSLIGEFLTHTAKPDGITFDGMITGLNPRDMRGLDHVDSMMLAYPGAFKGVGEFTIHKEFVSGKVAGGAATISDPAFIKTMIGLGERGLIAIVHNDIGNPDSNELFKRSYFERLKVIFTHIAKARAQYQAPIIWAHTGVGRYVDPLPDHPAILKEFFDAHPSLHVDISWNYVAYKILHDFIKDNGTGEAWLKLFHDYPDRFLFGTDSLAPAPEQKPEFSQRVSLPQALDGRIGQLLLQENPSFGQSEKSEHVFRKLVNAYLGGRGMDAPQSSHQRNANMYGWLWYILEQGDKSADPSELNVKSSKCIRGVSGKIIANCIAWANYERLFDSEHLKRARIGHTKALIEKKHSTGDLTDEAMRSKLLQLEKLDPAPVRARL